MLYRLRTALLFLSRLCGGEVNTHELMNHFVFLSRLCGGEVD